MRRQWISVFALTAVFGLASCEHENTNELPTDQVPKKVQNSFTNQYPNAEDVDWETEEGLFEASFDIEDEEHSILFDPNGLILDREIESELEVESLPESILTDLKKSYDVKNVDEVEMVQNNDGIQYEISIEIGEDEIELTYNEQGILLSTESENDDE